jgi:hypothetical protein
VTSSFAVAALPADELERIRERGADDFGNPFVPTVVTAAGDTPLRCCLRDAEPGERVALIAWRPASVGGPYAEVGPVFVHAESCAGYVDTGRYPEGFRHRTQLLRAYDAQGRQVDNLLVDGAAADAVLSELVARPRVAFVHSRNPMAGCYMFGVTPAGVPAGVGSR